MQRLLIATRRGRNDIEAEPVLVDTDEPGIAVLLLDDGERLILDANELRAALGAQFAPRSERRRGAACR